MNLDNALLASSEDKLLYLQKLLVLEDDLLVKEFFAELSEVEVAHLLASFPANVRQRVWLCVPDDFKGEVLAKLSEETRSSLMVDMKESDVSELTQDLGAQEIADILDTTAESMKEAVIEGLDQNTRDQIQTLHAYDDQAVGRYMNPEMVNIRQNVTLETVQRYIRIKDLLDEASQEIMVTNQDNRLVGSLRLVDLIKQNQEALVSEFMHSPISILDEINIHEAAVILRSKGLHFAPVVNASGILVGQLNIEDIIGITREDSEQTQMTMSGVSEDELFSPVMKSAQSRGIWLGINLATAFLAAYVIGQFEAVISQLVALAVLMPVVASMGGIAGSQTLSIIMRGLALGQIAGKNRLWLFNKELWVGASNGVIWAIVVGIVSQVWFNDWMLTLVISLAIAINMTVANVSGIAIPLLLKKMKIDPALSGAVILTTVTDVVGFMSFLGLATLLILD